MISFNPCPTPACSDLVNNHWINAIKQRNSFVSHGSDPGTKLPDLAHFLWIKFMQWSRFAAAIASFLHAVANIISFRSSPEVIRANTFSRITRVEYVLAFRHWPVMEYIANNVCGEACAILMRAFRQLAVSISLAFAYWTSPRPALRFRVVLWDKNLGPESLNDGDGEALTLQKLFRKFRLHTLVPALAFFARSRGGFLHGGKQTGCGAS
jgi:hypothetical protein